MLKMTTSLVLVTGLVVGGCDKKAEEGTAQKPTEGAAATPPPPPPSEAPKPLTGTALADAYKACVNLVNDAKFDDFRKTCIADGYQVHDNGDGSTRKAEELIGWFQTMKGAMPDFKLTPQIVLVSGRTILAVVLVTGTQTAPMKTPMGEMPATSKKIGALMFHKLAVNDANKATEEWAYNDPSTMMGQLGMAPKGAPPTRAALEKGLDGAPIVVVTADDAKEKANLEAAKKATDAINAGKWADAMALMQADVIDSDQAGPSDMKGTKDVEAGLKMWFTAFKGAKVSVDNAYAAGDYVVHLGKFTGTHDKALGPLRKTGKDLNLDYAEVILAKDGKAVQLWRFHSGMVLATQLGLMPAPGAPPTGGQPAAGSAAPTAPTAAPAAGSAAPTAAPAAGSAAAPAKP